MSLDTVNSHYLDSLHAVQEQLDVRAAQDIYAANGTKLLAKGASIDARIGELLTIHKLRQPLETQLQLDAAPLRPLLKKRLEMLLEQDQLLAGWVGGMRQDLLRLVATLDIPTVPQQTLTLIAARFPELFDHLLRVLALAWRLAPAQRYSGALLLGALFHDVGNLYIDPQLWQRQIPLSPSAWRQLDAHPLIGFVWASELKALPAEVSQLVLLHHERVDGSGYPRQLRGDSIGQAAEALALAEMAAGIFESTSQPVGQLITALKLQPQQFSDSVREQALVLVGGLPCERELLTPPGAQLASALHQLLLRFARVEEVLQQLEGTLASEEARRLYDNLVSRLGSLQRSFNSAGLGMLKKAGLEDGAVDMSLVWQELGWIVRETNWVTRHLSRDLERQRLKLAPAEADKFEPLTVIFLALSEELALAGL